MKERIQLNHFNTTIEDDDIIILNSLFQLPFLCHCDYEPAATSGREGGGHTLPWLIVCVISIVFGILAILGKSWVSIPDVALSIYFFIVVKSYRAELKEGTQVTV